MERLRDDEIEIQESQGNGKDLIDPLSLSLSLSRTQTSGENKLKSQPLILFFVCVFLTQNVSNLNIPKAVVFGAKY